MTVQVSTRPAIHQVVLGDLILDAQSGFASGKNEADGVIQVRMNNVGTDGSLNWDKVRRVPASDIQIKNYALQAGDVLFNATNSPDLVGKSAFFAGHDEPVVFSNHFIRLRSDQKRLHPQYLSRWLTYMWGRHVFEGLCTQWVNQASVRKDDLLALRISLPPLQEQKQIAAILDKADAIRRKRAEAIRLADDFLRSVFLSLVGPGATNYKMWPEMKISELAAPHETAMRTGPFGSTLRHSEFVDEGIAVLGIDNAVNNCFAWAQRRFITETKYEELKRYTVFPGDVIITLMGTTGRTAVVPEGIPISISTKHLATITPNRELVYPQFIAFSVRENPDVLHQIAMASKGAIMDGLNLSIIKNLKLRVPPIDVQKEFETKVACAEKTRNHLMGFQEESDNLFNSLVQRAFHGEL